MRNIGPHATIHPLWELELSHVVFLLFVHDYFLVSDLWLKTLLKYMIGHQKYISFQIFFPRVKHNAPNLSLCEPKNRAHWFDVAACVANPGLLDLQRAWLQQQ